jgi:hypothetical protein
VNFYIKRYRAAPFLIYLKYKSPLLLEAQKTEDGLRDANSSARYFYIKELGFLHDRFADGKVDFARHLARNVS